MLVPIQNRVTFYANAEEGYCFAYWTGLPDDYDPNRSYHWNLPFDSDLTVKGSFVTKARISSLGYLALEGVDISPAFDPAVFNYTATVGNDVTSVNVIAESWHSYTDVEGAGLHDLAVGENVIKVICTYAPYEGAEGDDLITAEYTITVTREAAAASTPKPNGLAQTGDGLPVALLAALAVASAALIGVSARRRIAG